MALVLLLPIRDRQGPQISECLIESLVRIRREPGEVEVLGEGSAVGVVDDPGRAEVVEVETASQDPAPGEAPGGYRRGRGRAAVIVDRLGPVAGAGV